MSDQDSQTLHRIYAIDLFNLTWDLMEKADRSQMEIDRMIHAAHASRYHWEVVGEPVNLARGEWQISRVYAILGRSEPCYYHAQRCLQLTLDNNLQDFDLAFAYEAMARAFNLLGNQEKTGEYLTLANAAGQEIKDEGDRKYFMDELSTIH